MKPFTILVDFINLYGAVQQEEVVGSGQNGAQLVWKTGPRKPKLSSVTLPTMVSGQFSNHVQAHGKLTGEAVTDYLSYTTRIYLMLQRYDTTSVFLYDREYRRLQARNGFRWEVGHLQSIWLREGQQQPARTSATIKAAQTATKVKGPMTTGGRTIWKMYNTIRPAVAMLIASLHTPAQDMAVNKSTVLPWLMTCQKTRYYH